MSNEATSSSTSINKSAKIVKLTSDNYLNWKRQILIVLELRGLLQAIEEDDVPRNMELQAKLALLESMDSSHQSLVGPEETAKGIMSHLEREYANNNAANKHKVISSFYSYKKMASDGISQHVSKMKEMRNAL